MEDSNKKQTLRESIRYTLNKKKEQKEQNYIKYSILAREYIKEKVYKIISNTKLTVSDAYKISKDKSNVQKYNDIEIKLDLDYINALSHANNSVPADVFYFNFYVALCILLEEEEHLYVMNHNPYSKHGYLNEVIYVNLEQSRVNKIFCTLNIRTSVTKNSKHNPPDNFILK